MEASFISLTYNISFFIPENQLMPCSNITGWNHHNHNKTLSGKQTSFSKWKEKKYELEP